MSFLEELYSSLEYYTTKYEYNDRFLTCIFSKDNKSLLMQTEFENALETEIKMIRKGILKFPDCPKHIREFKDYNIRVKSAFIFCMRITNIYKALFVLKKYDRKKSANIIEKMEYVKNLLQEEYKDIYGEYYNPLLEDSSVYRVIHDYDLTFVEYLIHQDFYLYFNDNKIDDYDFYVKNKRNLFEYMALVYLEIEFELLTMNMKDDAETEKINSDFITFYDFTCKINREIDILYKELEEYKNRIDMTVIDNEIKTHQLIVFKGDKMYDEILADNKEEGD